MSNAGVDIVGPIAPPQREGSSRAVHALGLASSAEWASWVVVLVFAFERGGATLTGYTSITLLVTAGLVTLLAGSVPDGPRPHRVFIALLALEAGCFLGAGVVALADGPTPVVILLTALALA